MKAIFICLAMFVAFSTLAKPNPINQTLSTDDESSIEIQNVEYDYSMFSDRDRMDCTGTLKFTVTVPSDVQRVLLYRTRMHLVEGDRLFFGIVSEWEIGADRKVNLSLENISWGVYFKICFLYDNDTRMYSKVHCVNSYIDKDDLDLLLNQASVESPVSGLFSIKVLDKDLVIDTSETVNLAVVDLHGNILFSGNLSKPTTIPIAKAASSVIITRYTINGKTTTNKFLLK